MEQDEMNRTNAPCSASQDSQTPGNSQFLKNPLLTRSYKVLASDVDRFQRLRMSRLFALLQELSIAHTEELGFPRETTLDRGFLWVISRIHIRLVRPILYDEHVQLESWPEPMLHMIYPRGYRLLTHSGEFLGEAAALWTLIDAKKRTIALPEQTQVQIPGWDREGQLSLPQGLSACMKGEPISHPVLYSELDLNGHVNNTRYFDWIDDLFSVAEHESVLYTEMQMNFMHEVTAGETVSLYKDLSFVPAEKEKTMSTANAPGHILNVTGILADGTPAFIAQGK